MMFWTEVLVHTVNGPGMNQFEDLLAYRQVKQTERNGGGNNTQHE